MTFKARRDMVSYNNIQHAFNTEKHLESRPNFDLSKNFYNTHLMMVDKLLYLVENIP